MSLTAQQIQEVDRVVKRMERTKRFTRLPQFQQSLKKAAAIIRVAAQTEIKSSPAGHDRYNTAKVSKKTRAPKGRGQVVASYAPGNLRRSIQVLRRYSGPTFALIGPRVFKGRPTGRFVGQRVDAYYAHMVHNGTENQSANPYMDNAARSAGPFAQRLLKKGTIKSIVSTWESSK